MKIKKIIVSFAVVMLIMFNFVACNDGRANGENKSPVVTLDSAVFEKAETKDIVFDVDLNGGTFRQIKKDDAALKVADYRIQRGSFLIKATYLTRLENGAHNFTFVTNHGTDSFLITVQNSKAPAVESSVVVYNADEGGSINVSVDTKGLDIQKIELDGFALSSSSYSFLEGALIFTANYAYNLKLGEHKYTLTTTAGSVKFIVSVVSKMHKELLDKYLIQETPTSSLMFTADTKGVLISAVKVDGVQLIEDVDYGVSGNKVMISCEYLAKLSVGIKRVEIIAGDVAYVAYAGAYGTKTSHLFGTKINHALMNDFECSLGEIGEGKTGIEGVNVGGDINLYGVSPQDSPLSINGKSYSVTSDVRLVAWIYGVKGIGFKKDTLYNVKMKIRGDAKTDDILKIHATWDSTCGTSDALQNFVVITNLNNKDAAVQKKDKRTTVTFVTDANGGYWEIDAYTYSDVADGSITFALVNDNFKQSKANTYTTIIDDVQITETDMPLTVK